MSRLSRTNHPSSRPSLCAESGRSRPDNRPHAVATVEADGEAHTITLPPPLSGLLGWVCVPFFLVAAAMLTVFGGAGIAAVVRDGAPLFVRQGLLREFVRYAEIDRIEHVPPMAAENDRIRLHLFGRRPLVFGASRQTARAIDERLVAASTYADRKAVPIALDFGSCSHSYGTRHARASTAVTTA